jgi:hypothetical protein
VAFTANLASCLTMTGFALGLTAASAEAPAPMTTVEFAEEAAGVLELHGLAKNVAVPTQPMNKISFKMNRMDMPLF